MDNMLVVVDPMGTLWRIIMTTFIPHGIQAGSAMQGTHRGARQGWAT